MKYYIVTDGWHKETFSEYRKAVECYLDWCNATEFVAIIDNRGNSINASW